MTPDTDDLAELIVTFRDAANRVLDALSNADPDTQLAILGLATCQLLRQLPARDRVPEALRWSKTLVATMRLDATNSAAVH